MKSLRFVLFLPFALSAVANKPANKTEWQNYRDQIERTLHITRPLPKAEPKLYGQFSPAPGVSADRVSYATDYYLRVPAVVYHSATATITKHPALIVVNGHKGDKSSWYAYWAGILYARAGAVVLTYDPIGEYERNKLRQSATSQHDEVIPPDDMARRLSGLMVTDVMQAVSYLAQRPDVDPKRIAVLGYSLGSFVSSLACAVDTRIHACVLAAGGDLDGPGGFWDNRENKMCEAIPYRSLAVLGDRPAILFALNAKRGSTLIWNGSADEIADIPHHAEPFFEDLQKRTTALAGNSKDIFEFGFTPGAGHRPYFLAKPVALWLEDKLKFPDWTKKDIQALPETRISDWAAKNQLTNPALTDQLGEGGLMAIGADIPAVPRDELHALPEAVWDSERDSYVYETWVERAKSAIRSGAP